ncbi:zonadhesin-like isoform X2 [Oncorhynchus keta]|uniref:zonadhesin-like isoform X2 n=1 Tax=Oncorhynchus keta TaxID=8018 RepID=UPI00227C7DB7|nr:zonadhesin-like isoform X2 [Oncorhynchus keta]
MLGGTYTGLVATAALLCLLQAGTNASIEGDSSSVTRTDAGTCTVHSNPHYSTFDGANFRFVGPCTYVLTRVCAPSETPLPHFSVEVKNELRGNSSVSAVQQVMVEVENLRVSLHKRQNHRVMVNGIWRKLPLSLNGGTVNILGNAASVAVETNFNLFVSYDDAGAVHITVPVSYSGKVCGMCGNFNHLRDDDYHTPGSSEAEDSATFGQNWQSEACDLTVLPLECQPTEEAEYASEQYCGSLVSRHGPFSGCQSVLGAETYFRSCVAEMCGADGDPEVLCEALHSYSDMCLKAGVLIPAWRTSTMCPLECGANSHYNACAKGCPEVCSSMDIQGACGWCEERCVCDPGFKLSGGSCVPAEDCGCWIKGEHYERGETFMEGECNRVCQCMGGDRLQCAASSCAADEVCKVKEGVNGCFLSSPATCHVYGDPHYITFDGKAYTFQGGCSYTLAKTCGGDTPVQFSVTGQNWNPRNESSAKLGAVVLETSGLHVKMQNYSATVNHVWQHLPVTVNGTYGEVKLYKKKQYTVMETTFGLRMLLDDQSRLFLQLDERYKGEMCGLCGTYSDDQGDDFLTPNGTKPETNVVTFANSWRVNSPEDDRCVASPPAPQPCDSHFNEQGYRECSKLLREAFKPCHPFVHPTPYIDSCMSDHCASGGNMHVTCDSLRSYVTTCEVANVTLPPWWNNTACDSLPGPPTIPPVTTPDKELCPLDCNFDKSECGWEQIIQDSFDWRRLRGPTPSDLTGPTQDHTTGGGSYMYIEGDGVYHGDSARMMSPKCQNGPGKYCLRFWYHMYGQATAMALNVYQLDQHNRNKKLWSKANNQGSTWYPAEVDIIIDGSFKIIMEGIRGSDPRSDVAFDDVSIHYESCSGSSIGGISGASVPSSVDGGVAPHPGPFGHYLYIEANSVSNGDTARLLSSECSDPGPQCLQFWYHMSGSAETMGLHVYLLQGRYVERVWGKKNNQGDSWQRAQVDLMTTGPFQIIFEGHRGTTDQSDVTIDDVSLHRGRCADLIKPPTPTEKPVLPPVDKSTTAPAPTTTRPEPPTTTRLQPPKTARPETPRTTTARPETPRPTTARSETPRPTTERPETPRPTTERPETPRPTTDRPETPRTTTDRPETPRPTTDRPETPRPTTERPQPPRPRTARPETPRPTTERPETPRTTTARPETPRPTTERSQPPRPTTERSQPPRPTTDRPETPRPTTDRPETPRPTTERPQPPRPTTDRPETPRPTTEGPQPPRPTNERSQPPRPTTERPETPRPTTARPETPRPTTEISQPPRPTTERSQPPRPITERSQAPRPTTERSQPPRPTTERSQPPRPTTARSQPPRPTTERSQPPRPTAERSQPPRPTTDRPETPRPTTDRPETSKPTTARPETPRPTTERPETPRPTTARPETPRPTTDRPETPRPTIERPETPRPTTERSQPPRPTTERSQPLRPTTERPRKPRPTTERSRPPRPTTARSQPPRPTTERSQPPRPTAERSQPPRPTTARSQPPRPTTDRPETPRPTTDRPETSKPTTARPETPGPTTERPETPRPTTARPETPRPTTARPETPRPTTERPETPRPTTERSQPPRPTTERSQPLRPTTERPRQPRPTTERPETPRPTTERSQPPRPTPERPQPPMPTTDRSQPLRPTTERLRPPRPTTERPRPPRPTTERLQPLRPTTERLRPPRPTTERPRTPRPTTERPQTLQPTTERPRPPRPTTERPRPPRPTTERPQTLQPTTERPRPPRPTNARPQPPTTARPTSSCLKNSHYISCISACQPTCKHLHGPPDCHADEPCVQGCVCDDGFVLKQRVCVPIQQCGCVGSNGNSHNFKENWYTEHCHQKCECDEGDGVGEIDCDDENGCDEDSVCFQNEAGQYFCKSTDFSECSINGEPEYRTFDNMKHDFDGRKSYILVQTTGLSKNQQDVYIEAIIEIVNQDGVDSHGDSRHGDSRHGNSKDEDDQHKDSKERDSNEDSHDHSKENDNRLRFRGLKIRVYNHTVEFRNNRKLVLDGRSTRAPVSPAGGLRILERSSRIYLKTDFGLSVEFDGDSRAEIILPHTYKRRVGGLCGNFDGNKKNDMMKPDNNQTKSIKEFRES